MKNQVKILLIEDQPELWEIMALALRHAGCDVSTAQTGMEGLRLAESGGFDLSATDIDLPGMSGLELCSHLKRSFNLQHIPVVFVTGQSPGENIHLAYGADDCIAKSFAIPTFAPRILGHINPSKRNPHAP